MKQGTNGGAVWSDSRIGVTTRFKGYHTELRHNDDGSYDFFTKGRIVYHYFDEGALYADRPNLQYIEDTNGNRLVLDYDPEGKLVEVREEFKGGVPGRSLFFEYTPAEILGERRIRRITGPWVSRSSTSTTTTRT